MIDFGLYDWDVEARKIAAAFELTERFDFIERDDETRYLRGPVAAYAHTVDNNLLKLDYSPQSRYFHLASLDFAGCSAFVVLDWDGHVLEVETDENIAVSLAKGLFNLKLLTADISRFLHVKIPLAKKLQWQVEYEARIHLPAIRY